MKGMAVIAGAVTLGFSAHDDAPLTTLSVPFSIRQDITATYFSRSVLDNAFEAVVLEMRAAVEKQLRNTVLLYK